MSDPASAPASDTDRQASANNKKWYHPTKTKVLSLLAGLGIAGGGYIWDKMTDEAHNSIPGVIDTDFGGPNNIATFFDNVIARWQSLDASDKTQDEKVWDLVFNEIANQLGRGDSIWLSSVTGNTLKTEKFKTVKGIRERTQYQVEVNRNIIAGDNQFEVRFDSTQKDSHGVPMKGKFHFRFHNGQILMNDGTGEGPITGEELLENLKKFGS